MSKITVKELREWLESQNDDSIVVVANPFYQTYRNVELIDTGKDGYKYDNIVIIKGNN